MDGNNTFVGDMKSDESMSTLNGDEVVITGVSGSFPGSENVEEFMENLVNKVDMVTHSKNHWDFQHPDLPKRIGSVKGFGKFDPQFFKVPYGQAMYMDGMSRKILEHAYGALFDAGVNPSTVNGSKVGVFIGNAFVDSIAENVYDISKHTSYMISGTNKSMIANRVTYWIDGRGPSYSVDGSCCSSMVALEHAFSALKSGQCDSAFVGGSNICLHPVLSINLKRADLLSLDGKTKCFDKHGDGYARSEAVAMIYLQKAREAKRMYAEVVQVTGMYTLSADSPFSPLREPHDIEKVLTKFYSEANVSTEQVEYVEASGSGLAKADGNEIEAIGNVFAKHRPIKVGCVKSNMGHSEAASGITAIIKGCMSYNKGTIPANLHYKEPQNHIPGVRDEIVQVVTDNVPFERGCTGINSFSYTGLTYHTLLKGHFKEKDFEKYTSSLPKLVLASGRTEDSVTSIFNDLKNKHIDPEQIMLLNDFFSINISGHTYRGYAILDTNEKNRTISRADGVDYYSGYKNRVWFMYSGMGSQWLGMGTELLRIPTFAAAIERCNKVLEPKHVDIVNILTSEDKDVMNNILNLFVGITAIQIGLTDVLKEMGIVPDKIIGHSLGELGCAYADGSLDTEETILTAYYRGLVAVKMKFINGLMAVVMLGSEEVKSQCSPEIEVACHNSSTSSTISGPADLVKKFVDDMNNHGVFAKEVKTGNIPYHSSYIKDAGPFLLSKLKGVIKKPKKRSNNWVCTSAPPEAWENYVNKYASAEYFTNNLLNYVYFYEAAKYIPPFAIIIEIAPHGLMQAIINKSHRECTHVSLTMRNHSDPISYFLKAVGKLYNAGLNPKVDVLYPKVQYPVATETPPLSPLVKWAHTEDWYVPKNLNKEGKWMFARQFKISLDDDKWNYLKGRTKNGVVTFPESAILVLVWETIAQFNDINYREMSVIFENIRFNNELCVKDKNVLQLCITIQIRSNRFEVQRDDVQTASGFIRIAKISPLKEINTQFDLVDDIHIQQEDIYNIFDLKGYSYQDEFQSIRFMNIERNKAYIKMAGNWTTVIDSLIQLSILANDDKRVSSLKCISKLTINIETHKAAKNKFNDRIEYYNAFYWGDFYNIIRCGGVQIENIIFCKSPFIEIRKCYVAHDDLDDQWSDKMRVSLESEYFGNRTSLKWIQKPIPQSANKIQVSYAGPSLRDCYKSIGMIKVEDNSYGMDFSGLNNRREKVMGLIANGALSSSVVADPSLLWPVPDYWSLEDAATVPVPYVHAYYSLFIRAKIEENTRVFVTGGTGAFGQAVISISLSLKCTVFTSVSTLAKKRILLRLFPELKEENIIPAWHDCLHSLKCDYVISGTTGKMRECAMQYVENFGSFLDVNDYDRENNMDFNLSYFMGNKFYIAVRLSNLFREDNLHERKLIQKLVHDGILKGIVKPLVRVVYSPEEIDKSFQLITTRKHYGRVLIKMDFAKSKLNLEGTS